MPETDSPQWLENVLKILSGIPTVAAIVEGWLSKAIPMAAELRPRAAFVSTLLAIFGLIWVWHRLAPARSKVAWIWLGAAVIMFLIYLTLWDQFPTPPTSSAADQVLRHALVLTYALTFLGFSVAFGLLAKAAIQGRTQP